MKTLDIMHQETKQDLLFDAPVAASLCFCLDLQETIQFS